jgi:hypothetical protein
LDRLAIRSPAAVAQSLAQDPALLAERPQVRGSIMARVDPLDLTQLRLLEQYVLAPSTSDEELRAFASVFPNGNAFVSQNLLTTDPTFDGATLLARDRAAYEAAREWLADPRFAGRRDPLLRLQRRLLEYHPEFARPDGAVEGR